MEHLGSSPSTFALQAVDKTFVQDICAATRPVEFDQPTLNKVRVTLSMPLHEWFQGVSSCQLLDRVTVQVIAEHFYQQGNCSVGDTFVREAGIPNGDGLKRPYIAMHSVLKEVR